MPQHRLPPRRGTTPHLPPWAARFAPAHAEVTPLGRPGKGLLVDAGPARLLVDDGICGLVPPVDARTIHAVILTRSRRACAAGLLSLARNGFRGRVVATPQTLRMIGIEAHDVVATRREDGYRSPSRGWLPRGRAARAAGLAGADMSWKGGWSEAAQPFGTAVEIAPGVRCGLHRAGCALGSAWLTLEIDGLGTVAVAEALGSPRQHLLNAPDPYTAADITLVGCGRDARSRRDVDANRDLLAHVVYETFARDGTVLVPAGPVDHVATVMYELARLRRIGCMPEGVAVCFDSPCGADALRVWTDAFRDRDLGLRARALDGGPGLLDAGPVTEARSLEDSRRGRAEGRPRVVIAGPHHGSGGRVQEHLRALLPDPRNCVALVGAAPPDTPTWSLASGAATVDLAGVPVPVRASVAHMAETTRHAGVDDVVDWLGRGTEPAMTYVLPGPLRARTALVARIRQALDWTVAPADAGQALALRREEVG